MKHVARIVYENVNKSPVHSVIDRRRAAQVFKLPAN
jgi:hypothetical protein